MYLECRDYLAERLKASGIKTAVYTSLKKLRLCQESHIGAVLSGEEQYRRNGSRTIYRENGCKIKRHKVFDRNLSFSVVIGGYEEKEVEEILNRFLSGLDRGLVIDGNFTELIVENAVWVSDEDSILKAKTAVQINVRFEGGVYKETGFAKVSKYAVDAVEMEKEE